MSIVITMPTGNVGGRVATVLAKSGRDLVLVARSKQKVAHLQGANVRVVEGSHVDPKVLIEATKGAKALFFATPPNLQATDLKADYDKFGGAAAEAISVNHIPYVVHLSSVGADLESGNGPVAGLFRNEKTLNALETNVVHLRPAYFMENTLMQVPTVASMGQMFTPLKGESTFPMIATRDIADRAAKLLAERNWSGTQIMELMGPEDMSYNRAAAILSEVLAKTVQHTTVPASAFTESILKFGGTEHIAQLFLELSAALETKAVRFHGERNESSRTPTTYREFAEQVFKPLVEGAQA